MPIVMADIPFEIVPLLDQYKVAEQSIQTLIGPISHGLCLECGGNCCQEAICRESIQSPFLNVLIQMQNLAYNDSYGWLADSGCRLRYGRPQVCYSYFCQEVMDKQPDLSQRIDGVIRAFTASGDHALGGSHLISVENLDELSLHKISKIIDKMNQVFHMIASTQSHPPA